MHRYSLREDESWRRLRGRKHQVARVEVTPERIAVRVLGPGGVEEADFTIPRRAGR